MINYFYLFAQALTLNNIKIGYNSSLPSNIAKIITNLDKTGNDAISDSPPKIGPILLSEETIAVKLVSKPFPLVDSINKPIEVNIIIKAK